MNYENFDKQGAQESSDNCSSKNRASSPLAREAYNSVIPGEGGGKENTASWLPPLVLASDESGGDSLIHGGATGNRCESGDWQKGYGRKDAELQKFFNLLNTDLSQLTQEVKQLVHELDFGQAIGSGAGGALVEPVSSSHDGTATSTTTGGTGADSPATSTTTGGAGADSPATSTTTGGAGADSPATSTTTGGTVAEYTATSTTPGGTDSTTSTTSSGSNAGFIGVYTAAGDYTDATQLSQSLGKTVVPADYVDYRQPAAQTTQYMIGQYAGWVAANPGKGMILGVPLTFDGQSLSSTASGANNAEFTNLAQQLVAAGQGNDTIRLGWEMNGSWQPWNDGNPQDYINAYNNAAEAMKAVPGANFSFDWNPSAGEQNNIPTEDYYPGNKNVNSIGVDVYDWNESNPNATPAQTWNELTTEAGGLNELAAFAQKQGEAFAIPEWAVSTPEGQAGNSNATSPGMGDDPSFVNNIANFLAQQPNVAFQSYFNNASGGVGLTLGTAPQSDAAYVSDFSNGGTDGAAQ